MSAAHEDTANPTQPTEQGEPEKRERPSSSTWVSKIEETANQDVRSQPWKALLSDQVADRTVLAYRTWDDPSQEKDLLNNRPDREESPSSGSSNDTSSGSCDGTSGGTATFSG